MAEKTADPQRLEKIKALRAKQQAARHGKPSAVSGATKASTSPYVNAYYWEASFDTNNNLSVSAIVMGNNCSLLGMNISAQGASAPFVEAATVTIGELDPYLGAGVTVNLTSNPGTVASSISGAVWVNDQAQRFYLYQLLPVTSPAAGQKAAAGR